MARKDPKYALLRECDHVDEGEHCYSSDYPTDADEPLSLLAPQLEGKHGTVDAIPRWEWVIRGVLSLLSVIFFILWITAANMHKCTYVTKYSPANEAIEYIERFKYRGALRFTTPWRGDESENPSSDIDAAWNRISTDVKPIRVTEVQSYKMDMMATPTTVEVPQDDGGGYLASLEVTHHLHCLNMLRKATYREYYESFDPVFQIEDQTLMNQLDTCIELLREVLMCHPDVNMLAHYWIAGRDVPFSDFNTIHRCKNFDKILDWAAWKAVNDPRISNPATGRTEDGATA